MWGWLTSIINKLGDIAESIISLPITIFEGIINGIKEIFIPDTDSIKESFNITLENIKSKLGLNIDSVKDSFDSVTSQPVEDIQGNYNLAGIGTLKLTFFDTKFFKVGIDYFRPLLRGFIVLMLFFYNYKQILTFLGQDPSIYGGSGSDVKKGGGKE